MKYIDLEEKVENDYVSCAEEDDYVIDDFCVSSSSDDDFTPAEMTESLMEALNHNREIAERKRAKTRLKWVG